MSICFFAKMFRMTGLQNSLSNWQELSGERACDEHELCQPQPCANHGCPEEHFP